MSDGMTEEVTAFTDQNIASVEAPFNGTSVVFRTSSVEMTQKIPEAIAEDFSTTKQLSNNNGGYPFNLVFLSETIQ